jgi:hypothetical protein
MRLYPFILVCCISSVILNGQQPVGSWTDHLRYDTTRDVAVGNEKIFASTGSSLLVFNKEFNELGKLSPVNGLTETRISSISWSEENQVLVVAYHSSNIDLVYDNYIYNLPDILNAPAGDKTINRIRINDRYAYLATGSGIIVIDLVRKEIRDTWKPAPDSENNMVFDIAFGNGKVFAATELGVWYADLLSQGLSYFGNWKQLESIPGSKCTLDIFCGGKLYVNVTGQLPDGDKVYSTNGVSVIFSEIKGVQNRSFDPAPSGFTVTSSGSVRYFDTQGSLKKTISGYGWGTPDMCRAIIKDDDIWIGDLNYGLVMGEGMAEFSVLALTSPASDHVSYIASLNGKTVICAGGADEQWNRHGRLLMVSVYENNKFTNLPPGGFHDAIRCCIDPADNNHFYIASWGDGLFEYSNNILINHYDETNSPLGNEYGGDHGIKICGLTFDKSGNLWVTRTGTQGKVFILKPDGSWINYPLSVETPVMGDIISTSLGQKWILIPEGNGIIVLDDNDTPDLFSDDRYIKMPVIDTEGNYMTACSMAEDLDGNIWIGTGKGPVIYYNSDNVFDSSERAKRIKIPRNDGSGLADYLLGTETITSISVDGANRKWFGTSDAGACMISESGDAVLKTWNKSNSPLFSDSIAWLAVDNKSGEVWFGTSEGLLSVRDIATSGEKSYSGVYSFPNPVREDFEGNVTITGLMRDTQVKITDVSGNLVNETVSAGGQASWDLTTYNGRRVVTGVYLVFCANEDGSRSCVTKILVISR